MSFSLIYLLFIPSLLQSFASPQSILSLTSSNDNLLYTFSIDEDRIYLGRQGNVSIVGMQNLSFIQDFGVPRQDQADVCLVGQQNFCLANVIDHIFLYRNHTFVCGSNGGEGGCFLYSLTDLSTFTNYQEIHLSGNIITGGGTEFIPNAIFVDSIAGTIYSQYFDVDKVAYILDISNFSNYIGNSPSFVNNNIPLLTQTFQVLITQSSRAFFNNPIVGNVFRFNSTNSTDFDFIYFPFTETVQETPSDGVYAPSSRHGRLGRICANDYGQHVSEDVPVTFTKITIDCRDPTGVIRYPPNIFYIYTSLKQLFYIDADNIFGFFTSQDEATPFTKASAVCKFISDRNTANVESNNIEVGFRSNYFATFDSSNTIPENSLNPWTCNDLTTRDDGIAVVNPLFNAAYQKFLHLSIIQNEADLLFDKHFEAVAMDTTYVLTSSGLVSITLFYATTSDGYIIKMMVNNSISFLGQFKVADSALLNPEVREVNGVKYLFALTTNQLYKTSLQLCYTYSTGLACFQDPECIWIVANVSCIQYSSSQVYPSVPSQAELTIDDTCQLIVGAITLTSITVSITCDVSLATISNVTISPLNNVPYSTPTDSVNNMTSFSVMIQFNNLYPLTGYNILIERTHDYGYIPGLEAFAYTNYSTVCPYSNSSTSISIPTIDSNLTNVVCINCSRFQYCDARNFFMRSFSYEFPWDSCTLIGSISIPPYSIASCDAMQVINRCASSDPFQHFNFSYIPDASSVRVFLLSQFSLQELGVERYTLTLNGVSLNIISEVTFMNLSQNTNYTLSSSAYTLCGSVFNSSMEVSTLLGWPSAVNCVFSSSGSVFSFDIVDSNFCFDSNRSRCMDIITRDCSLYIIMDDPRIVSTIQGQPGQICEITVFPRNRPDLAGAFGCTTRYNPSVQSFAITFTITTITPNSVLFNLSIIPENELINTNITLSLQSGSITQRQELNNLLSSSMFTSGFQNLAENTFYMLQVVVGSSNESISFTTDQLPPSLNASCFPIADYSVENLSSIMYYDLKIELDPMCTSVYTICSGYLNSSGLFESLMPIVNQSITSTVLFSNRETMRSFAFTHVEGSSCPDISDSSWRIILNDSIIPCSSIVSSSIVSSSIVSSSIVSSSIVSSSIVSSSIVSSSIVSSSFVPSSIVSSSIVSSSIVSSSIVSSSIVSSSIVSSSTTMTFSTASVQSSTTSSIPITPTPSPDSSSVAASPPTSTSTQSVQMSTTIPNPTPTPTPTFTTSPTTPVVVAPLSTEFLLASTSMFYAAVIASVLAIIASAGGLSTLFILIAKYPTLVQRMKAREGLKDADVTNDIGMNPLSAELN